jgi:DNA-binding MarR family transcriptional regulator
VATIGVSCRLAWRTTAPTMTITRPAAASGASQGKTWMAGGTIKPKAAASSATPMNWRKAAGSGEAALRLGYDPSNITALADALEARGLVERRTDPSDRRVRTLARTAEGERVTHDLEESLSNPPEAFSRLSPEEQEQLLRLLSKVFGPTS